MSRSWRIYAGFTLLVACSGPRNLGEESAGLLITEIMSENTRSIEDDFNTRSDWIEITNYSARAINLKNYGLSDNEGEPYKWTFPYAVIPAGESMLVYASNRDLRDPASPLHTNFRISGDGEPVLLTSPAHRLVDRAPPVKLLPNISWGRVGTEKDRSQWHYFFQPTPLEPNETTGRRSLDDFESSGLGISEVAVRSTDGFVDLDGESADWIELVNDSGDPIDLDGYGLTDNLSDPFRWRFSGHSLDAGDHMVVFASAKNRDGHEPHTNFRMQAGEYIGLFTPKGTLVDLVSTEGGNDHVSLGRRNNDWVAFGMATPGRPNDVASAQAARSALMGNAIVINEVMSESSGNALDMDWVELKNESDEAVELTGYGLTDDEKRPFRWRFPPLTLRAGEMTVIGLTGQSCAPPDCRFVEADFRLSAFGETLTLSRPDGAIEDRFKTGRHLAGISSGRSLDGRKSYFDDPTPGKPNTAKPMHGYAGQPSLVIKELADGQTQLEIPQTLTADEVYYTIGGDPPSKRSRKYQEPLLLKPGMVVRARAYKEGFLPSPIMTRTFLGDVDHPVPIVAITVDPYQMFNKVRGLHERGPGASDEYPYKGANFWSKRELLGHVEFLDEEGELVLSTGTGVQIFGAWSRGIDKKSFKITARSEFGTSVFEYPVFGENTHGWMDQIVLRSGGQDALDAGFRDALATWLAQGTNVDLRRFAPAVLYING
ncbi:MAG: lamin tail domain-containing protein, partial [Myxococcota bacterium]